MVRLGVPEVQATECFGEDFSHGEALRILPPSAFHVNLLPELL